MSRDVRIDRAGPQDLDAVLALLAEHKLPLDGLRVSLVQSDPARANRRNRSRKVERSITISDIIRSQSLASR